MQLDCPIQLRHLDKLLIRMPTVGNELFLAWVVHQPCTSLEFHLALDTPDQASHAAMVQLLSRVQLSSLTLRLAMPDMLLGVWGRLEPSACTSLWTAITGSAGQAQRCRRCRAATSFCWTPCLLTITTPDPAHLGWPDQPGCPYLGDPGPHPPAVCERGRQETLGARAAAAAVAACGVRGPESESEGPACILAHAQYLLPAKCGRTGCGLG